MEHNRGNPNAERLCLGIESPPFIAGGFSRCYTMMKWVNPQGQVEMISVECERQDPDGRFLNDYFRELIYGGIPDTVSSGKE